MKRIGYFVGLQIGRVWNWLDDRWWNIVWKSGLYSGITTLVFSLATLHCTDAPCNDAAPSWYPWMSYVAFWPLVIAVPITVVGIIIVVCSVAVMTYKEVCTKVGKAVREDWQEAKTHTSGTESDKDILLRAHTNNKDSK